MTSSTYIDSKLLGMIKESGDEDVPSIFKRSTLTFPEGDNLSKIYNGREYYCRVINIGFDGYLTKCAECPSETGSGDTEDEAIQDLSERVSAYIAIFRKIFDPSPPDEQRQLTEDWLETYRKEGYTISSERIVSFKLQNIQ
jgi:hypothetical protein